MRNRSFYSVNSAIIGIGLIACVLLQSCGGEGDPPTTPNDGAGDEVSLTFSQNNYSQTVTTRDTADALAVVNASASNSATVSYGIGAGNDENYFVIDANNGEIRLTIAGLSAPAGNYRLTVDASVDVDGVDPVSATVNFNLGEFIALGLTSYQAEPTFRNTTESIARIRAQTGGESPVFAIRSGNDQGFFAIDSSDGRVTFTTAGLNLRSGRYLLAVSINLESDNTIQRVVMLTITIMNNALVFDRSRYTVNPVDLTGTDPLIRVDTLSDNFEVSYSIVSGNGNNFFEINRSSGEISLTAAGRNGHIAGLYTLVVRVMSEDPTTIPAQIEVGLIIPAVITPSATRYTATISHRDQTMALTRISASHNTVGTLNYGIASGNDQSYFRIDSASGEVFFTTAGAMNAVGGDNNLQVEIGTGASDDAVIAVAVDITLSNRIRFNPDNYTAMPNFRNRIDAITTVGATADNDIPFEYQITAGNDDDYFQINETTGVVRFTRFGVNLASPTEEMLLAGEPRVYRLTVSVNSSGNDFVLVGSATVEITLGEIIAADVATANVLIDQSNFNTTATLAILSATTNVPSATLSYSIVGGNEEGYFALNPVNAELTLSRLNFYIPDTPLMMTTRITSSTGNVFEAPLTVGFAVNIETSIIFEMSSYSFDVNLANPLNDPRQPVNIGAPLNVEGRAVDTTRGLSYSILSCTDCPYAISDLGQLSLIAAPDLTREQSIQVRVRTVDTDGATTATDTTNVSFGFAPVMYFINPQSGEIVIDTFTITEESGVINDTLEIPLARVLSTPIVAGSYSSPDYSLVSAVTSGGMDATATLEIDALTGILTWVADGTGIASYTVVVRARAASATRDDLSAQLRLAINVDDNTAPVLTAPTVETSLRLTDIGVNDIVYTVTATDNRVGALTVGFPTSATPVTISTRTHSNPSPLFTIDGLNLRLATNLTVDDAGLYEIRYFVSDEAGNRSLEGTLSLTVLERNRTPRLVFPNSSRLVGLTQTVTSQLSNVREVEPIEVGGNNFVYALTDDAIRVYTLQLDDDANSNLAETTGATTLINGGQSIRLATVQSTPFLLVTVDTVDESDSIRSYRIHDTTGALTLINEVTDTGTIELDGPAQLEVGSVNGITVAVVAAKSDHGIGMFVLDNAGRLTHRSSLDDGADGNLGLSSVDSIAIAEEYIYTVGEDRISVIDTTDAIDDLELSYHSHFAGSETLPITASDRLYISVVGVSTSFTSSVSALVVARDDTTTNSKSNDGVYLIPLDLDTAGPTLQTARAITVLDGNDDDRHALGDPLFLSSHRLGASTRPNIISVGTADRGGSVSHYLARYSAGSWTLTDRAIFSLSDATTDEDYLLSDPSSANSFEFTAAFNNLVTFITSPSDNALSVIQLPILELPDLAGGTFSPSNRPQVLNLGCDDDDCSATGGFDLTSSVLTIIGSAIFSDGLVPTIVPSATNPGGNWRLEETINLGIFSSAIDLLTDQYLLEISVSDAEFNARYYLPLGLY